MVDRSAVTIVQQTKLLMKAFGSEDFIFSATCTGYPLKKGQGIRLTVHKQDKEFQGRAKLLQTQERYVVNWVFAPISASAQPTVHCDAHSLKSTRISGLERQRSNRRC